MQATGFAGALDATGAGTAMALARGPGVGLIIGVGVGLPIGVAAGLLRGSEHRGRITTALGACGALVGALGGVLSQLPGVTAVGGLPLAVTSSLAWVIAGMLAGLVGYGWSRWGAEAPEPEDEDGEPVQPPSAGETWVPPEPARRVRPGPVIIRLLPIVAVSAASLVGAAILAPATVALALLAVGCLGFFVALVLGNQERRLRDLERRFRGWS
jgi:hypothetical protein